MAAYFKERRNLAGSETARQRKVFGEAESIEDARAGPLLDQCLVECVSAPRR